MSKPTRQARERKARQTEAARLWAEIAFLNERPERRLFHHSDVLRIVELMEDAAHLLDPGGATRRWVEREGIARARLSLPRGRGDEEIVAWDGPPPWNGA